MLAAILAGGKVISIVIAAVIVLFAATVAVILVFCVAPSFRKKEIRKISESSIPLQKLRELNERTNFFLEEYRKTPDEALAEEIEDYSPCYFTIYKKVKKEETLNDFDFLKCMRYEVRENPEYYLNIISGAYRNRALYEAYEKEADKIERPGKASDLGLRTKQKKYEEIENRLWEDEKIQAIVDPFFRIYLSYTNPKTGGTRTRSARFSLSEIEEMYSRSQDLRRKGEESEETLIPTALKLAVMKRDGFCCQSCGKSYNDGAILDVEQIAQAEPEEELKEEQLKTFCWDCYRSGRTVIEAEGKPEAEPETEARQEAEPEFETESEAKAEPEAELEPKVDVIAEEESEAVPESQPEGPEE